MGAGSEEVEMCEKSVESEPEEDEAGRWPLRRCDPECMSEAGPSPSRGNLREGGERMSPLSACAWRDRESAPRLGPASSGLKGCAATPARRGGVLGTRGPLRPYEPEALEECRVRMGPSEEELKLCERPD